MANIEALHGDFAAEITGVDLKAPISDDAFEALHEAVDGYGVVVFPGQFLDDAALVAFAGRFGTLETPLARDQYGGVDARVTMLSNVGDDGDLLAADDRHTVYMKGNLLWHSDSSYKAVPAKYSLLSGRIVTEEGGETQFADMRAAYDELDDKAKALIEGMVCNHSLLHSRGSLGFDDLTEEETRNFTPVRHSLSRTHPVSGRKSIYLSAHIGQILGLPRPEAMCLIRDLTEAATQREFVYSHKWQQYDLVIWDNRQTMHRVTAFNDVDEIRDMRRTTVAGDAMTAAQVAA